MWRPDRSIRGPDRPTVRDIEPLNRVFSEAFTDRYSRDGMVGVRVPHLNPLVWRYALEDAGDGAMIWRDADGQLIAFNMVHRSGSEGWMGPLAVRPDRQGEGFGSRMVRSGIDWLKSQGASVIGLETMPRTVDNIGFYSRLGLVPRQLTVTLVREVTRRLGPRGESLRSAGADPALLAECRALADRLSPGVDFTRELVLTAELRLGDTTLVRHASGDLAGFALWHSAALAAGRPKDELRILKLAADGLESFDSLLSAVETAAAEERVTRLAIRCQTEFDDAYLRLINDRFRVHWTDLRMTLHDHPQPRPLAGIVMSNWEI